MKPIELALQPVEGYLLSIARNPVDGWYEIEVGLPSNWVFDQNNEINCEVLDKTDAGSLIKISPKNNDIEIDDLIAFVEIIIDTNKKIADKEKQFTDKMQEMKGVLETEAKKFYQELDELRANSFKNNNNNFVKTLRPEGEKRHRRTKAEMAAEKNATTVTSTEVNSTLTESTQQ